MLLLRVLFHFPSRIMYICMRILTLWGQIYKELRKVGCKNEKKLLPKGKKMRLYALKQHHKNFVRER